jgi:hypothetical protein
MHSVIFSLTDLRGWKQIDGCVDQWSGDSDRQCRLLVGMQRLPQEDLRAAFSLTQGQDQLDNQTALRLKKKLAEDFRNQLTFGVPTNADEVGLRRLAAQLKAEKLVVKLFLRHTLHAKLYLCFRLDPINPIVGYLGSSNLTFSGLSNQGELNVDVLDHDAALKLAKWFEDRWSDKWCVDISAELIQVIEQSWAREAALPPYHIYVKMAYHLAQEARAGLSEFRIPSEFGSRLFDYQVAAVKIAAHHLNKRSGVLIGDVVGLGKTLMATALAKIFQDDHFTETLILCPKNLVKMWEDYVSEYRLLAKVLSVTKAIREHSGFARKFFAANKGLHLPDATFAFLPELSGSVGRNATPCEIDEATGLFKTLKTFGYDINKRWPDWKKQRSFPEQNDDLLWGLKRVRSQLFRLHRWGVQLHPKSKDKSHISALSIISNLKSDDPLVELRKLNGNDEELRRQIASLWQNYRDCLIKLIPVIADRILPVRRGTWAWETCKETGWNKMYLDRHWSKHNRSPTLSGNARPWFPTLRGCEWSRRPCP